MATKPVETKKAKKTAPRKTTEKKASPEGATPTRIPRAERNDAAPCRISKCKRPYRAKGYCKTHYRMWRHNEYGNARYKQCSDTSCARPMAYNRHGYCEEHFQSYYVKGETVAKAPAAAAPAKPEKKEAVA